MKFLGGREEVFGRAAAADGDARERYARCQSFHTGS